MFSKRRVKVFRHLLKILAIFVLKFNKSILLPFDVSKNLLFLIFFKALILHTHWNWCVIKQQFKSALEFLAEAIPMSTYNIHFLMTDSICHSSLPRMVLEKVTLTTIQFRIHPRTKVDPMFQCVCISMPLKSCPYKSSATCAWSMARVAEKKPALINICANNKGADQPAHPPRLISAFVACCCPFFFRRRSISQT